MKKIIFVLIAQLLCLPVYSQIFHENFEFPDSVVSSGLIPWSQNYRLYTSYSQCDSAAITFPGDYGYLTTASFSTIGYDTVILYFNQICKIEFFDNGYIDFSIDSGLTWSTCILPPAPNANCVYYGMGLYATQNRFQEASYASWMPGITAAPSNSWWKREIFDLSTALSNVPNAMIRFRLEDGNNTGGASRNGWFLDDLQVDTTLNTDLNVFANKITGSVFFDANSDQIFDSTETPIIWQTIELTGLNNFTLTSQQGKFELGTNFIGNFTVECDTFIMNNPDFSVVPQVHAANFTALYQTDSLNDFAIQPVGIKNDLLIQVTKSAWMVNNMGSYFITYENNGNTILTPSISFYGDTSITFDHATITPALISQDSIHWILPAIGPFSRNVIWARFSVPGNWFTPGSYLANATIFPVINDFTPFNNTDTTDFFITPPNGYPFDPNDIRVDKDTLTTSELASSPFLEYTIRFQNVGTAPAININIENPIHSNLDLQTLEILGSSHQMDVLYNPLNDPWLLKFKFENIYLPDSNTNEQASHGFLMYRIRPINTLVAGDSISNFADIFFDFNLPVRTNTALTSIVAPLGHQELNDSSSSWGIYPNPASGIFSIKLNSPVSGIVEIKIFDLVGKVVLHKLFKQKSYGFFKEEIVFEKPGNGIYFVKISSGDYSETHKLLRVE